MAEKLAGTYDRDTESHRIEGDGGEEHEDEDNPMLVSSEADSALSAQKTYQRVFVPVEPAFW